MNDKKELRRQVLAHRKQMPEEMRALKSKKVVEDMLQSSFYRQAHTLLSFIPFGDEIDIRPLLEHAVQEGKKVAVPKTDLGQKRIDFYLFEGWSRLVPGVYGILEPNPKEAVPAPLQDVDLIVVPGVAFDKEGNRLGYGGGFYDRFLARLSHRPTLITPCFAEQVVEAVPTEEHDFQVDCLFTDQGAIACSKSGEK